MLVDFKDIIKTHWHYLNTVKLVILGVYWLDYWGYLEWITLRSILNLFVCIYQKSYDFI